jgi:dUTP pyrophosphatase
MMKPTLKVKKLRPDACLPVYATEGAGAFDMALPSEHAVVCVLAGGTAIMGTGLAFEIPRGKALKVLSRSGHGFNYDVTLANSVGLIDSDYIGEVKVKLINHGSSGLYIKPGDRIAQAMFVDAVQVEFEQVEVLTPTARGDGGLGSTGA